MNSVFQILKLKLSINFALPVVVLTLVAASYFELTAIHKLDTKPGRKVSCIRCHTSKGTLAKIADKSGDPLYLVHNGDLTLAQLKEIQTQDSESNEGHFRK